LIIINVLFKIIKYTNYKYKLKMSCKSFSIIPI